MPNSTANTFRPRLPPHLAVEVHRVALRNGRSDEETLQRAIVAGLQAMSGPAPSAPACHARDRSNI